MPTIDRVGPYRLFFFSNEGNPREPVHVHVQRDNRVAKFWLEPQVSLLPNSHFSAREIRDILAIIKERRIDYIHAWHDHFGN